MPTTSAGRWSSPHSLKTWESAKGTTTSFSLTQPMRIDGASNAVDFDAGQRIRLQIRRSRKSSGNRSPVGARVDHETERSLLIHLHRREHSSDPVDAGGGDVLWSVGWLGGDVGRARRARRSARRQSIRQCLLLVTPRTRRTIAIASPGQHHVESYGRNGNSLLLRTVLSAKLD